MRAPIKPNLISFLNLKPLKYNRQSKGIVTLAAESVLLELAKAAIALVYLSNTRPGAAATAAATLVSKCFQT